MSRTLDYAKIYGLVQEGCYPYNTSSLEHTPDQCNNLTKQCTKHKIGDYCVSSQSENIKQEVFNYGPVIVTIPVYRDFLIYQGGLYQVYAKNQRFSSEHAVKIIGWDVIDGKNCWLIENSWGEDWGVNGTGCIMAESQELHVERFTLAVALNNEQISDKEAINEEAPEGGDELPDEEA